MDTPVYMMRKMRNAVLSVKSFFAKYAVMCAMLRKMRILAIWKREEKW